mgnify:FL=1
MISSIGILSSWLLFLFLGIILFTNNLLKIHIYIRLIVFLNIFLFLLLEIGLFIDDFSVAYISNYSASSTPPLYKFASLWGALDGSILLWNLTLSIFMLFYLSNYKISKSNIDTKIYSSIMLFFVGYTIFSSSPFAGCVEASNIGCNSSSLLPFQNLVSSQIGRGPNPLLQNHPLMAIHPPFLYIGYVGMSAPFVATISRLALRNSNNEWISIAQKLTFIPWLFLTIGISLGAVWSYEVLGWGGYWAWDPVENVSFIPWLLSTAFLHSAKVTKQNNSLLNWNYVLVGLMFLSTLFGTFITRSGVLISVHAFSNGSIGTYLLIGILLFSILFLYIGSLNTKYFLTSKKLNNIFGRSGFFIANNILLFSSATIVFIGTIYPLFYETFFGRQITIGRNYFDVLVGPILLMLLFLIIFSIKLPVKDINLKTFYEENIIFINSSLLISILFLLFFNRSFMISLTIVISFLLITMILKNFIKNFNKVLSPSFWSGQIAHLGLGVLAIGIILNFTQSFSQEFEVNSFENFLFSENNYQVYDVVQENLPEKTELKLPISNGKITKYTSLNIFNNSSQQVISSPAIYRNFLYDTYISVKSINNDAYKLIVRKNFGILIIWVGLFISSISFIPKVKIRK